MRAPGLRSLLVGLRIALLALFGAGCASSQFHPQSAVPRSILTMDAVRFHEGDIPTLAQAGGEFIGTITSQGHGTLAGQETLFESASSEAGESGGTHIILTDRGVDYYNVTFAGRGQTDCTAYGNRVNCNSTYTPPHTESYARQSAAYMVVRVPPENWSDLPRALRPVPRPGLRIPKKVVQISTVAPGDEVRRQDIAKWDSSEKAPAASTPSAGLVRDFPEEAGAVNLSGLWIGDYHGGRIESVRIEHAGTSVNATKVTGDENVPAGKPTFRAILNGRVGEGMGHGADKGYANPRWVPGELRVLSDREIEFTWIIDGRRSPVRYSRQSGSPRNE